MAAGAGFIANLVLWKGTGYFDPSSAANPLLHLWSLGVEEQFYIVWPLVLLVAWKLRINALLVSLGVLVASFILNIDVVRSDPHAAFYSPFTRFWELQVGGALAYLMVFVRLERSNVIVSNVMSWLGIIMISLAAAFLNDQSPFPGWLALLPTFGAAFLIFAGPDTWFNRQVLANPVAVFIGLISYPLYLWHWPLLTFARILTSVQLSFPLAAATVLLSIGLAYLTYSCIERPIRSSRITRAGIVCLCSTMAVIGLVGYITYTGGFTVRHRPIDAEVVAATHDWIWTKVTFDGDRIQTLTLPGTSEKSVIFLGDSHMEQYSPRIRFLYAKQKPYLTAVFATAQGCPPFANTHRINYEGYECDKFYQASLRLAEQPTVKKVVFASFWGRWLNGGLQGNVDDAFRNLGYVMHSMVRSGKEVYIILPSPVSSDFEPEMLLGSRWKGAFANLAFVPHKVVSRIVIDSTDNLSATRAKLVAIAHQSGAHALDPFNELCYKATCIAAIDGEPVYSDQDHLRATFVEKNITFLDRLVLH
jgi:hypothetical protein